MESTPAPATPRRILAPAPLKRDLTPSAAMIWRAASTEDLYMTACDDCQNCTISQLGHQNFTYLARSHHHTTTDSVQRIRSNTSTSGDSPAEQEGGEEVTLKRANENNRLDGVVHAEVQT